MHSFVSKLLVTTPGLDFPKRGQKAREPLGSESGGTLRTL